MTWLGDELGRIADDVPERDLGVRAIEVYRRRRRNLMAVAAAAVVVVTVLAGTVTIRLLPRHDAPDAARPVAPPEQSVIDVSVEAGAEAAPLYVARSKGYFAAEGLTVRPVVKPTVMAVLPELGGGTIDLAQTDYVSSFLVSQQIRGIDLKIVGGLHQAEPGSLALVVRPGSGIRTVADLKGKRIAVTNPSGLGALSLVAMMKRAGLDRYDAKLVIQQDTDMVGGLDDGKYQAALLPEPFVAASVHQGRARVLQKLMTGEVAGLPSAGWTAEADWIRANPRTLAAFQRALAKARRLIASDPAQAVAVLPQYLKVTAGDLDRVALGTYPAELDVRGLQRLADMARRYTFLRKSFDVRSIVASGE
ncbi:ABC transporter substrate-binding protein [Nonomuraea sp. B12E4]|uniref:ABC transporter substrate-binding protein n=1 Tax=Nonomuraea sp. B12E4 TaxID=3153564 RepID=UPI00325F8932